MQDLKPLWGVASREAGCRFEPYRGCTEGNFAYDRNRVLDFLELQLHASHRNALVVLQAKNRVQVEWSLRRMHTIEIEKERTREPP